MIFRILACPNTLVRNDYYELYIFLKIHFKSHIYTLLRCWTSNAPNPYESRIRVLLCMMMMILQGIKETQGQGETVEKNGL